VACTGVHGANRLASNSLLEGLVFARRIADDIARDLPPQADPVPPAAGPRWVVDPAIRGDLQRAMTRGAGVLRSADSLAATAKELARLAEQRATPRNAAWEATNLLTVASALVASAQTRRETRGCHWREDFPVAEDEWRGHLLDGLDRAGRLTQTFEEMP
jgi:L-aspartate oxidase